MAHIHAQKDKLIVFTNEYLGRLKTDIKQFKQQTHQGASFYARSIQISKLEIEYLKLNLTGSYCIKTYFGHTYVFLGIGTKHIKNVFQWVFEIGMFDFQEMMKVTNTLRSRP